MSVPIHLRNGMTGEVFTTFHPPQGEPRPLVGDHVVYTHIGKRRTFLVKSVTFEYRRNGTLEAITLHGYNDP